MEEQNLSQDKEEYAVVLDFLPNGYPFEDVPTHKKLSIAQAMGEKHFMLLELVPKKGLFLQPLERVYIGDGKRDKIHHIKGRLQLSRLTETAKAELPFVIADVVKKEEKYFVNFFNKAQPLTTRMHSLELIPGVGKKHMWEIIQIRDEKPFESFQDIRDRVKQMPDPEKAIVKRIMGEIEGNEKHRLFVQ